VFEKRALRGIFGKKRDDVTGGWKNCIIGNFITYTFLQILLE
jgi:hypothetical protein